MANIGYLWKAGLTGAIVAAVANLVIYAAGRGANVDFTLVQGGAPTQVGAAAVLLMSIGSVLAGTALATLLARRGAHRLRWAQVTGAAVAVLSVAAPLSSADATATGILLAAMHVITGSIYVLALEKARRRQPAQTEQAAVTAAS